MHAHLALIDITVLDNGTSIATIESYNHHAKNFIDTSFSVLYTPHVRLPSVLGPRIVGIEFYSLSLPILKLQCNIIT